MSFPGVEGESLRFALRELAISSGSACATGSGEPSAVLRSLGRPDHVAEAALRFSLGRQTTATEIDQVATQVAAAVEKLRALSPVAAA